jgi:hypothetical protein
MVIMRRRAGKQIINISAALRGDFAFSCTAPIGLVGAAEMLAAYPMR